MVNGDGKSGLAINVSRLFAEHVANKPRFPKSFSQALSKLKPS